MTLPNSHLLDMLPSKISASRQEFDEFARSSVKCRTFVVGVFGAAEADEEPALSAGFVFSFHDGLIVVDVPLFQREGE